MKVNKYGAPLYTPLSRVSSLILYPCGVGAQGDLCIETISDLLPDPIWFLIIPYSFNRGVFRLPAETFNSVAGETWQGHGR
jgi:hypothetical protein